MDVNKRSGIKRKYITFADLLLLGFVLCTAVFGLLNLFGNREATDLKAVIRVSGEVYDEIALSEVSEPYDLTVRGYDNREAVLHITADSVEFGQSPCPDHLCVNTGKLTKSGDSAVCLPLRISVQLEAQVQDSDESHPDAIVG